MEPTKKLVSQFSPDGKKAGARKLRRVTKASKLSLSVVRITL